MANKLYPWLGKDTYNVWTSSDVFFDTNDVKISAEDISHTQITNNHQLLLAKENALQQSIQDTEAQKLKSVLLENQDNKKNRNYDIVTRNAEVQKLFDNDPHFYNRIVKTVESHPAKDNILHTHNIQQLYATYINTIFPQSAIPHIVYHGTAKEFEAFDINHKSTGSKNTINTDLGFYFTKSREVAWLFTEWSYFNEVEKLLKKLASEDRHEDREHIIKQLTWEQKPLFHKWLGTTGKFLATKNSKILPCLVNVQNPHTVLWWDFAQTYAPSLSSSEQLHNTKKIQDASAWHDGIIVDTDDPHTPYSEELNADNYIVFNQNNIHILWSQKDLSNFTHFLDSVLEKSDSDEVKSILPQSTIFQKQLSPEDKLLLETQYHKIVTYSILQDISSPSKWYFEKWILPSWTLIHGSTYSPETVRSIKNNWLLSWELIWIHEDWETHYCADFFRVPETYNVAEYMQRWKEKITSGILKLPKMENKYINNWNWLFYVVDTQSDIIKDLLQLDAYWSWYDRLKSIISYLPKEKWTPEFNRLSAILWGIPSCAIQAIIIWEKIVTQKEYLNDIKKVFGNNVTYLSTTWEKL